MRGGPLLVPWGSSFIWLGAGKLFYPTDATFNRQDKILRNFFSPARIEWLLMHKKLKCDQSSRKNYVHIILLPTHTHITHKTQSFGRTLVDLLKTHYSEFIRQSM